MDSEKPIGVDFMPLKYKTDGFVFEKKRQELNLTQAQVANEVGITEKTYRDIEKNKRTPQQDTLARLIAFLKLEYNEVFIFNNSNLNIVKLQEEIDTQLELNRNLIAKLIKDREKADALVENFSSQNTLFYLNHYFNSFELKEDYSITKICSHIMNLIEVNGVRYSIFQEKSHLPILEMGNLLKSRQLKLQILDYPDIEREVGMVIQRAYRIQMANEHNQQTLLQLISQIEREQILSDSHARALTILRLYLFLSTHWEELYSSPSYYHTLAMICIVLEDPLIDPDDFQNKYLTLRLINLFLFSFQESNAKMRSLS